MSTCLLSPLVSKNRYYIGCGRQVFTDEITIDVAGKDKADHGTSPNRFVTIESLPVEDALIKQVITYSCILRDLEQELEDSKTEDLWRRSMGLWNKARRSFWKE